MCDVSARPMIAKITLGGHLTNSDLAVTIGVQQSHYCIKIIPERNERLAKALQYW